MASLPPLQYDRYYRHDELTQHLQALAAADPARVRLHNLYTTLSGREEWLVEVTDFTAGCAGDKPGYLVHANIHAPEVSGTTAALRFLERLLTEAEFSDLLTDVVFYVIPRVNPDGAEYALATGGAIRSKFEVRPCKNGLVPQDINGDGLILQMRWPDPFGPYVPDEVDPRLMRLRGPGDQGPFYEMTTEGVVLDYDGGPLQHAQRGYDFNRNWGHNWKPEPVQWGAGDYAFSQPELKAVADWVYAQPNIIGMLGFHNGCNAVLRPSATTADEDLRPGDLKVMRELAAEGAALTGFPDLAVRMYKTADAPPICLQGHFTDWGYFALGLHVFEIELGNSFNAAGITTAEYFAADDSARELDFRRRVMAMYDAHPEWEAWVDWHAASHPQLGPVEVGGVKTTWYACPPPPMLEEIGTNCADFIAEHARRRPRLLVQDCAAEPLGGGVYRIRATVANRGLLPTHITAQAEALAHRPPVTVRLQPGEGVEVVSRGQLTELPGLAAMTGHADLEWFVRTPRPHASVEITVSHPKSGAESCTVPLG